MPPRLAPVSSTPWPTWEPNMTLHPSCNTSSYTTLAPHLLLTTLCIQGILQAVLTHPQRRQHMLLQREHLTRNIAWYLLADPLIRHAHTCHRFTSSLHPPHRIHNAPCTNLRTWRLPSCSLNSACSRCPFLHPTRWCPLIRAVWRGVLGQATLVPPICGKISGESEILGGQKPR